MTSSHGKAELRAVLSIVGNWNCRIMFWEKCNCKRSVHTWWRTKMNQYLTQWLTQDVSVNCCSKAALTQILTWCSANENYFQNVTLPFNPLNKTDWAKPYRLYHIKLGNWAPIQYKDDIYQYRKSHCGDKTILRPSYLHNGISYTGKMSSLYCIGAPGSWLFNWIGSGQFGASFQQQYIVTGGYIHLNVTSWQGKLGF